MQNVGDIPNLTGKSLKVVMVNAATSSSISLQHQLLEEPPSRQKRKDCSLGKMIISKQKTIDRHVLFGHPENDLMVKSKCG